MADASGSKSLGKTAVEIIFSCAICQASISEINGKASFDDGLKGETEAPGPSTAKFWLVECSHLLCGAHFDGGGVPFFAAGSRPEAPCPICRAERGVTRPQRLYWVHGLTVGLYDSGIPQEYFVVPPMSLQGSNAAISAMKFQFISLLRFGAKLQEKFEISEHQKLQLQKLLTAEAGTGRSLQDKVDIQYGQILELEGKLKDFENLKSSEASLKQLVQILKPLTRENEHLKSQLAILGFAIPKTDYTSMMSKDKESSMTEQRDGPGNHQTGNITVPSKDLQEGKYGTNVYGDPQSKRTMFPPLSHASSPADSEGAGVPLPNVPFSGTKRRFSIESAGEDTRAQARKLLSRDLMPPPPLPTYKSTTSPLNQTANNPVVPPFPLPQGDQSHTRALSSHLEVDDPRPSLKAELRNLSLQAGSPTDNAAKSQQQDHSLGMAPNGRFGPPFDNGEGPSKSHFPHRNFSGNDAFVPNHQGHPTSSVSRAPMAMPRESISSHTGFEKAQHGLQMPSRQGFPPHDFFPSEGSSTASPLPNYTSRRQTFGGGVSENRPRDSTPWRVEKSPFQPMPSSGFSDGQSNYSFSDFTSTPKFIRGQGYEGRARSYTDPRRFDTGSVASPFFKANLPGNTNRPNDNHASTSAWPKGGGYFQGGPKAPINRNAAEPRGHDFWKQQNDLKTLKSPRIFHSVFGNTNYQTRNVQSSYLPNRGGYGNKSGYNNGKMSSSVMLPNTNPSNILGSGRLRSDITNFWREDTDMPDIMLQQGRPPTRGRTSISAGLMNPPVRKSFSGHGSASNNEPGPLNKFNEMFNEDRPHFAARNPAPPAPKLSVVFPRTLPRSLPRTSQSTSYIARQGNNNYSYGGGYAQGQNQRQGQGHGQNRPAFVQHDNIFYQPATDEGSPKPLYSSRGRRSVHR